MGHQRAKPTKTTAQSSQEGAKNSARSPGEPESDLSAAIGNRALSRQIQALPKGAGMTPKIPPRIQAKPLFQGLSGELAPGGAESGTVIQAKLTVGEAGDPYEREADRIAADVASQLNTPSTEAAGERPEAPAQQLQKKPAVSPLSAGEGQALAPELETSIYQAKGRGNSLPTPLLQKMERAFGGADFSGVKIHSDASGDRLNRALNARAFTTGKDIFFRQGEYKPGSQGGQELIAHELTHVVQQTGAGRSLQKVQFKSEKSGFLSGIKNIGSKIGSAVLTAGKGILGIIGNAGAFIVKSIISTIAGGLQKIFNLFNLPQIIKGNKSEGLFDKVRSNWQEITNNNLSGKTKVLAFFESLGILLGDVRDITAVIALISGLIGLIPGAQPALAVSGVAGTMSFWTNNAKLFIDSLVAGALRFSTRGKEDEDRYRRTKNELIGDVSGLVLGGAAGAAGAVTGGAELGEALKSEATDLFKGAAETVSEQIVAGIADATLGGLTEASQDTIFPDAPTKGSAAKALKNEAKETLNTYFFKPLDGLKNSWEKIQKTFQELIQPFKAFWEFVNSVFKQEKQAKEQGKKTENSQNKQLEKEINPTKASEAEKAGTGFIDKVMAIAKANIQGFDALKKKVKIK